MPTLLTSRPRRVRRAGARPRCRRCGDLVPFGHLVITVAGDSYCGAPGAVRGDLSQGGLCRPLPPAPDGGGPGATAAEGEWHWSSGDARWTWIPGRRAEHLAPLR